MMLKTRLRIWIGLLGLGLAPGVLAQTAPMDSSRSASHGLEALDGITSGEIRAIPDLANELVNRLGQSWTEIRDTLPVPDSTSFADALGEAWWSVPGFPVDGFRAFIQHGRVESVTLDFSHDGPDLAAVARRVYDRLGSPRADGFYATDQTGYPFSMAIDAQANRITARAVPGQLVRD